jgi:hypothetical protein
LQFLCQLDPFNRTRTDSDCALSTSDSGLPLQKKEHANPTAAKAAPWMSSEDAADHVSQPQKAL